MPTKKAAARKQSKAQAAAQAVAEAQLRARQQAFVDAYVECLNAAEAARRAGYSARSARNIGWENLTKPDIRKEVDRRLAERRMSQDEVLARLSEMASSSMADFIKPTPSGSAALDLGRAARAHKLGLIKKFVIGVEGVRIELYDAQAALVHMGRYHKLWVDRQEHTGADGGPIDLRDLEAVRSRRWAAAQAALKEADKAGAEDDDDPDAGAGGATDV